MSGRTGRWARRLGVGLGLVLVLLLALQGLLSWATPLEDLVAKWSPNLGLPAHVESARVRILPYPMVRLEGLHFENGGTIEHVVVGLEVAALLRGGFKGGRAEIRGGRLFLVRRADGSVQIRALAGDVEKKPADPETPAEEGSGAMALPALPHVVVRDLVLQYMDYGVEGGVVATDFYLHKVEFRTGHAADALAVEASGRLDAEPGPASFEVTAQVGAAGPGGNRPISVGIETHGIDPAPIVPHLPPKWGIRSASGSLDSQVSLAWRGGFEGKLDLRFAPGAVDYAGIELGGEIRFEAALDDDGTFRLTDGRVQADTAGFQTIQASELDGKLSFAERTVTFAPLGFRALGGSATARGTLVIEDPLAFDLDIGVEKLSLYRLEHPGGATPPRDPTLLDAQLTVEGRWQGGADWLEPIQGSATLSMQGGQVASGQMFESLVAGMVATFERHRHDTAHRAYDTIPLEKLSTTFKISGGRGNTQDLKIDTPDYELTAAGWLDGTAGYHFDGALAFTPHGLSRLLAAASIRGRHDSRGDLPKVPFRISGNIRDGGYHVDFEQQPLTALVIVPWSVNEIADLVGEAGKGVVNRVKAASRGGPEGHPD